MRSRNSGFSLIEITIAMAVLSVLMTSVAYWILKINKQNFKNITNEEIKKDLNISKQILNKKILNAVKIEPLEDMYSVDDGLYQGFNGIDRVYKNCRYQASGPNDEKFSILRFTSVNNQLPEQILRGWNDANTVSSLPGDEMRISYRNDPRYIFQDGVSYDEIVVLDADGKFAQRYEVNGFTKVTTHLHPYSDLPTANTYVYTRLNLAMPKDFNDNTLSPQNVQFITGSVVYSTNTYYLCVSNTSGNLIMINSNTNQETVLVNPSASSFKFEHFKIKYLSLNDTNPFDLTNLKIFPNDNVQSQCVNVVYFDMQVSSTNPSQSNQVPIEFKKAIELSNFDNKKPSVCY